MKHLFNDSELREMGYVCAHDGHLLDNRDGFYDAYPNDFIATYDTRVAVAISKGLLWKLFDALGLKGAV